MTRLLLLILTAVTALSANANAAFNGPSVGEMGTYTATKEDTLVQIARKFNLGFVELRAANPKLDPWIPGEGVEMIIPAWHILPDAPREGVVINLAEMRLFAYINGDNPPNTFPLAIGREGLETPVGSTTVVRKVEGPIWRPTDRMRREDPKLPESVGPGPENPMGTHALYLGWPTYAIHGTNKPYGIGRRASSGCMRMYPEDIIKMFETIPTGTKVTAVNQPIKLAWIDNMLYLEAHPDMDQAIQMEETGQVYLSELTDEDMQKVLKAAGPYKDKLHWAAIRNAIRERTGYPVMIARRPIVDDQPKPAENRESVQKQEMPEAKTAESSKAVEIKPSSDQQPQAEEKAQPREHNL